MGWFYAEEIGSDSVYLSERHWDRRLFLVRKFVSKKNKNEGNGEGNLSHFFVKVKRYLKRLKSFRTTLKRFFPNA